MPLPTSGAITAAMIRNEFGGGNPFYISDYYRGGPRVPNIPENANVPTSGVISFWHFYGASASPATTPLTMSISPSRSNRSVNANTGVTISTNVTGMGGVPPYTYQATWGTAALGFTLSGTTGQSPSATSPGRPDGNYRSGSIICRVTDSTGATVTRVFDFEVQWGTPL